MADLWTLLHPPYTLWNLSYVALGAAMATDALDLGRLGLSLLAFFLAVGIAAHALDELQGRPLGTTFADRTLVIMAVVALIGAAAIGIYGCTIVSWWGAPFIAVGVFMVCAYNMEWFGGAFHSDLWFAFSWGAFPCLAGAFAQRGTMTVSAILVAGACVALSLGQRRLSTPARNLRRQVTNVSGQIAYRDGSQVDITNGSLRLPLEGALRALSVAVPLLATAAVISRL